MSMSHYVCTKSFMNGQKIFSDGKDIPQIRFRNGLATWTNSWVRLWLMMDVLEVEKGQLKQGLLYWKSFEFQASLDWLDLKSLKNTHNLF